MTSTVASSPTPPAAQAPVRTADVPHAAAGATYLGPILAVVVIAVGAVGVRDAVNAIGWVAGPSWLGTAVAWADGRTPAPWIVAAGVIAALLGVALIVTALKPRRRRATTLAADTAVYLDLNAAARIATAAARSVPGVTAARSTAGPRTVTVRVTATSADGGQLQRAVADAVRAELSALSVEPRIRVRVKTASHT